MQPCDNGGDNDCNEDFFFLLFFSSTTSLGRTNNACRNASRLKLEEVGGGGREGVMIELRFKKKKPSSSLLDQLCLAETRRKGD